jgi:DNA polymerase III subunit beta
MTLLQSRAKILVESKPLKEAVDALRQIPAQTSATVAQIRFAENRLFLSASSRSVDLECVVLSPGFSSEQDTTIHVPLAKLGPFIAMLPDAPVEIKETDQGLNLMCGDINASTLTCDSPGFLPAFQNQEQSDDTSCAADKLLRALCVSYAADPKALRIFNGIEIAWLPSLNNSIVQVSATDQLRIATIGFDETLTVQRRILIPIAALPPLERFLKSAGNKRVNVSFGSGSVFFGYEGGQIRLGLLEGTLPDFQAHIPSTFDTEILVQRQTLFDAIRRLELYGEEKFSPISKVELIVSQNDFIVQAHGEVGNAKEKIPAQCCGLAFRKLYQAAHIIQALKEASGSQIKLAFDATGKLLIQDEDYMALIMGIKKPGSSTT